MEMLKKTAKTRQAISFAPLDERRSLSESSLGHPRVKDRRGPEISSEEGDNIIAIDVTAESRTAQSTYLIRVTKAEAPPTSGGPLPLFQSASAGANPSESSASAGGLGEWKSRLIFAAPLADGGVRFVFLVPAGEFQIEETDNLLTREWRPLPEDKFQATRESLGDGQDRLTVILPEAAGKHRFLRLTPATQAKKALNQGILPEEAILFPFFPCFVGGRRQNRGGLKKRSWIMKNLSCLLWLMLVVVLIGTVRTPPVSGGPLPLSFQPSSAPATAGKSRLMAAASLPNGGIRFVFHAPNVEVEVESSLDLTAGSWTPLPNSQFKILREETMDGQTRLTVILTKAEEEQRFLRLIPLYK